VGGALVAAVGNSPMRHRPALTMEQVPDGGTPSPVADIDTLEILVVLPSVSVSGLEWCGDPTMHRSWSSEHCGPAVERLEESLTVRLRKEAVAHAGHRNGEGNGGSPRFTRTQLTRRRYIMERWVVLAAGVGHSCG